MGIRPNIGQVNSKFGPYHLYVLKSIMESKTKKNKFLLSAIVLILICVVGFHLLLPFLGIAIAMTGAAWGIIVATIAFFSITALLFFMLPVLVIILLSFFAFGWAILAIALFPFLFPLIMPVFIILLFIAYISSATRRKNQRSDKPKH